MSSSFNDLPDLGVGIVYWPELHPLLEHNNDLVNVIEVEPQAMWHETNHHCVPYIIDPNILQLLQELPHPKLIHSVGMPIGSSRSPVTEQLPLLCQMVNDLHAVWASEHLSFSHAASECQLSPTGFLLPPLQTMAGVERAVQAIQRIAASLPIPFAIETGVNYLKPQPGELSDGQFIATITDEANCGILLDLHNIWTNELNGRQSIQEFLSEIPLERVVEIHLAGGCEYEGYWLDAHSDLVPRHLIEITASLIPRLPNLHALIFEILPIFVSHIGLGQVQVQLEQLHQIWKLRRTGSNLMASAFAPSLPRFKVDQNTNEVTPEKWEDTLGAIVTGQSIEEGELFIHLNSDPGSKILRSLVESVRAGMVMDGIKLTSRLLMLECGVDYFQQLLSDFWKSSPPQMFTSAEALNFATYVSKLKLDVPYLQEVLNFEGAQLHEVRTGETQIVHFPFNPVPLLQALLSGQLPSELMLGNYQMEITSTLGSQVRIAKNQRNS